MGYKLKERVKGTKRFYLVRGGSAEGSKPVIFKTRKAAKRYGKLLKGQETKVVPIIAPKRRKKKKKRRR